MWSLKPKRRRSLIEMTTSGGAGVSASGRRREWRLPPGRSNNPTHSARRAGFKILFVRWELTQMVDHVSTVHTPAETTALLKALFILESQFYVHNSSVTHSSHRTRTTTECNWVNVLKYWTCTYVRATYSSICIFCYFILPLHHIFWDTLLYIYVITLITSYFCGLHAASEPKKNVFKSIYFIFAIRFKTKNTESVVNSTNRYM